MKSEINILDIFVEMNALHLPYLKFTYNFNAFFHLNLSLFCCMNHIYVYTHVQLIK